ncbi:MAG: peptide-methionine (S)-S-oxide reductase MsrA [Candidatus Hermodarchaeia archaeon]|jgi:peptide-methionine (S)-S-oxide reductase
MKGEPLLNEANELVLATLGGGCFWCTEAVFLRLKGVHKVESGYSGGAAETATYEQVCSGRTDHVEVIQITYDPTILNFRELLDVFFTTHDPTTLNRQGNDVGTQYRSVVFYHNEEQKAVANTLIQELDKSSKYSKPIVTAVEPFTAFFKAEEYHQNFFACNPNQAYVRAVIPPKLSKLEKKFAEKLKPED